MYEHSEGLRTAVGEAVKAAWGSKTIVYQVPEEQEAGEYAVILSSRGVDDEDSTPVYEAAVYRFAVVGRFKRPNGGVILATEKEQRLRTLGAVLTASGNFGPNGVGYLPQIISTEVDEEGDPDRKYYEVGLEFQVSAQELRRGDLAAYPVEVA